ncbi:MAG: hypothetical protein ACRDZO_03020 [Egibacteraceae bacterium]
MLNSGAVIAWERGDAAVRGWLTVAREQQAHVTIPAVVVAETVRGTRGDANVNRCIKAVGHVSSIDEVVGRRAGALLGQTGGNETADALVVAEAAREGHCVVLTGDLDDLGRFASFAPTVEIARV